MNMDCFRKRRDMRVRLRPVARRVIGNYELHPTDDEWIITGIGRKRALLENTATGHLLNLFSDHIKSYEDEAGKTQDDADSGILSLECQVYIGPEGSRIVPLKEGNNIQ